MLICNSLFSQKKANLTESKIVFNSLHGYSISTPFSAIYDANGWLWVLGENKLSNEFVIGEKEVIIQRFDGNNFFELEIPFHFEKKIIRGTFYKHNANGFYLKLWFEIPSKTQLFYIDINTLKVSKVHLYDRLVEKNHIDDFYYSNNKTRILITNEKKLFSAEINGLAVNRLDSISHNNPKQSLFIDAIYKFNENTIAQLLSKELFLINKDGKFVRELTKLDFIDAKGNYFTPTIVRNHLKIKNEHFFLFENKKKYFKYNSTKGKFIEEDLHNNKLNVIQEKVIISNDNRILIQNNFNNIFVAEIYDLVNNSFELSGAIETNQLSKYASNDINSELAILHQNNLEIYFFKNSKIQTFLKGKSVRAINQLSKNKFIISTDLKGFYEVNLRDKTENKIQFYNKKTAVNIVYPRDIFVNDSTIITNDVGNIFYTNKKYEILSTHNSEYPSTDIIKVGDTIFKGGDRGRIFKFSEKSKNYTEVSDCNNVRVKEFATNGKDLFATTNKGIFLYKNGKYKLHEFTNLKTENLLSIYFSKSYGVLVTSKLGEVYQFNESTKKLNLLYKDQLKVSIVGVIEDNDKNLWLNTYAGIILFKPLEKQSTRFAKKDGVFELEGNRFSTFKDSSGNIFIGSYKGVSYFNPKDLQENDLNLKPIFSSISFFNKNNNKWETIKEPSSISDINELTLPAFNQRFSVKISVLGSINPYDVKYQYRLIDNKEPDNTINWVRLYRGNEIVFSNLAAGSYTLQVEARSLANRKIGETLELTVVSRIFFYKTWWFFGLVFLAIILFFSFLFKQFIIREKLINRNKIAINDAKTKDAMMIEIHHRIKNNLQVVSGLLSLQAFESNNKEVKEKLKDSQARIESIAGIHDILYKTDNREKVLVATYFKEIIAYNKTVFPLHVNYQLEIGNVKLSMDKAIPLGLIFNELIINSNKHAFTNTLKPVIKAMFLEEPKNYVFTYQDNGDFKSKEMKKTAMGKKIIEMMIQQLQGEKVNENATNFNIEIRFPKK